MRLIFWMTVVWGAYAHQRADAPWNQATRNVDALIQSEQVKEAYSQAQSGTPHEFKAPAIAIHGPNLAFLHEITGRRDEAKSLKARAAAAEAAHKI